MAYTHLSPRERTGLFYLAQAGYSLREIARRFHRSHTTLSRELKRNGRPSGQCYCDRFAQRQANHRKQQPRHQHAYHNHALRDYVTEKLQLGWSPEIIANRLPRESPLSQKLRVSHETIYQWLYREAGDGGQLYRCLVRAHRKRRRQHKYGAGRGVLANRCPISQRPAGATNRSRYGHWEGDTMVGYQHQGRIVTHVERKSRYLLARVVKDGTAASFTEACRRSYALIPVAYRRTLTLDNGSENAQHERLAKHLHMQIYFATPYASWERGTNENTNGLLRRTFPAGTNFLQITPKQLNEVVSRLNHRPRKCLNYRTPFEVLNSVTHGALAT